MPARPVYYEHLLPNLQTALDQIGAHLQQKSSNRRRRVRGFSADELEAAKRRAKAITAERDLPEPQPVAPEPYKSADDLLYERLEKFPLVDTSKAEQLPLLHLPATK